MGLLLDKLSIIEQDTTSRYKLCVPFTVRFPLSIAGNPLGRWKAATCRIHEINRYLHGVAHALASWSPTAFGAGGGEAVHGKGESAILQTNRATIHEGRGRGQGQAVGCPARGVLGRPAGKHVVAAVRTC